MSYGETVMPLLARARAEIDPRWQRYMAFVDRMFWGPQGTFAAGNATPAQLIEQMHATPRRSSAASPGAAAGVGGRRRLGAAVQLPRRRASRISELPHANDRDDLPGPRDGWRDRDAAALVCGKNSRVSQRTR